MDQVAPVPITMADSHVPVQMVLNLTTVSVAIQMSVTIIPAGLLKIKKLIF